MKKLVKKLVLRRNTLRTLDQPDLLPVAAGGDQLCPLSNEASGGCGTQLAIAAPLPTE